MKDYGYIGRIKSGGQQIVKAPVLKRESNKSVVTNGNDLRNGK